MLNHNGIALIFKDKYITYDELNRYIEKYSSTFPIISKEKAIIFAENSLEWVYTFLSLWEIGAISIPVDFKYTSEEIAYIIDEANPRIIFVSNETEEIVKNLLKKDEILIINLKDIDFLTSKKDIVKDHDKNNISLICYSSGTTGTPKGVELTRKNIISNANDIAKNTNLLKKGEKNLALLPFHHMYPLVNNIFLNIPLFDLAAGYLGAIVFLFLIAYDVNRLRKMSIDLAQYETHENIDKYSIRGALSLYINVINLFLYIMRIVSSQKKKE